MSDLLRNKFDIQITVTKEVQRLVDEKGMGYIEAAIQYAEQTDVDIETVAAILNKIPYLKAKIQMEAEGLNLVPKMDRLELE